MEAGAKMFDALMLTIELAQLNPEMKADKKKVRVQQIAETLYNEKATLPQVQAKMAIIKEVMSVAAWENVSMAWLEKVREELRDLMQFLKTAGRWFIIDIQDVITDDGEAVGVLPKVTYKQRVIDFLATHRDLPVLRKINRLEQLTGQDIAELERILWHELGSKDEYANLIVNQPFASNIGAFIRSMVGIDRDVAMQKFSTFISGNELNYEQEEFLSTIVNYVCENGDITKDIVVNEEPFCDQNSCFMEYMLPLANYIDTLHTVVIPLHYAHSHNDSYLAAAEEAVSYG